MVPSTSLAASLSWHHLNNDGSRISIGGTLGGERGPREFSLPLHLHTKSTAL